MNRISASAGNVPMPLVGVDQIAPQIGNR